ncbi:MAG: magnesium transporter [Deltaproteobacteria bacterium]|nr:magnesium transporter [Deltaproteobacteria bacterium]
MREDILSPLEVQKAIQDLSVLYSGLAAERLLGMDPGTRVLVLRAMSPTVAHEIISQIPTDQLELVLSGIPEHVRRQWEINQSYPEGSVGRLMDAPVAVFPADMAVDAVKSALREIVRSEFVTYAYAVDQGQRLVGVVVMRDLLFAEGSHKLEEIMLRDPFYLLPEQDVMDVMKDVVLRHYPVYPVCDGEGRIKGLVRGFRLFESQAFEITAQAGTMVGVDREEHTSTPWWRSFLYRHPWLQLNLLTAFVAGAVVSIFQDTIDKMVILAAFLPVLAGQSGNTGCQALAVTLRGLTLGEIKGGSDAKKNLIKEALLGFLNGALVGLSAGVGMYFLAKSQGNPDALLLSVIVVIAMIGSCLISGVSGTIVPLVLKRMGADPATASSIFLTTATDVASMGMLLGLATWVLI